MADEPDNNPEIPEDAPTASPAEPDAAAEQPAEASEPAAAEATDAEPTAEVEASDAAAGARAGRGPTPRAPGRGCLQQSRENDHGAHRRCSPSPSLREDRAQLEHRARAR